MKYLVRLTFATETPQMYEVYSHTRHEAWKSAQTMIKMLGAEEAEIWATEPYEIIMITK